MDAPALVAVIAIGGAFWLKGLVKDPVVPPAPCHCHCTCDLPSPPSTVTPTLILLSVAALLLGCILSFLFVSIPEQKQGGSGSPIGWKGSAKAQQSVHANHPAMNVGGIALVNYGEPGPIWHCRALLAPAGGSTWAVLTPDHDVYVEELAVTNSDYTGFFYCGETGLVPGHINPFTGLIQ